MGQGLQRAVNAARASQGKPPRKRWAPPRHPAEVTRDRLGDHYEKWYDKFSASEIGAISQVREALYRIAEEEG